MPIVRTRTASAPPRNAATSGGNWSHVAVGHVEQAVEHAHALVLLAEGMEPSHALSGHVALPADHLAIQ